MKPRRIFYGWWIVAAGMGIAGLTAPLFVYGFSAFFIPWRESFGWSRAVLGGVIGISRLEGGLIAPVAGWLIDKYGPRRIMFLGLGMMGLGFLALSQINSLAMLYVVFLGLLATGSSLGVHRPIQVAVANWFVRRRGRAMGLLMTGYSIGGTLVFLFALAIKTFGWRGGAIIAGLLVWGVGFPLALIIRHKPEQMGLLPDGDRVPTGVQVTQVAGGENSTPQEGLEEGPQVGDSETEAPMSQHTLKARHFWMRDPRPEIDLTLWQALRTRAFWLMAVTWALWASVGAINIVHLAPFLSEELELDYVIALGAVSFFAFGTMFGRLGFGFLADYVNIRLLAAILVLMEGLGVFLFSQVQTLAQVPFYISIFAVAHGGTVLMQPMLQGYFFGKKEFGTIGGLVQFMQLPAGVGAPILVGWMADSFPGGYRLAFKIIGAMLALAALCILLTRRPRHPLPANRPPRLHQVISRG